jgi:uncharacterized repeat protein (TIGR01451 family)
VTIAAAPAITVTKTADVSNAEVGEEITYTYHITNTGNITLTSVSARDDVLGTVDVSSTLAMRESMLITETYSVTEDDFPGPLSNTIAVSGTWSYAGDTGTVSASDTVTVSDIVDSVPPEPPVIGDGTGIITTTDSTPVITSTAEPGSTIRLTIELEDGSTLVYETTADANGDWSIDLGSDTPISGELPEGGLPPGEYALTVTATDAAGNVSEPTTGTLVIEGGGTAGSGTVYLPIIVR